MLVLGVDGLQCTKQYWKGYFNHFWEHSAEPILNTMVALIHRIEASAVFST